MVNTTLCYIQNDKNQTLLLHRTKKKNDLNENKWIGVGGKFEDKESPEECLVREVFEETGLTLESYSYRAIVTFVSDKWETEYMHVFTADKFSGSLKECNEGELLWVDNEKVPDMPTWEGDKIFLEKIWQDEPFFSLKLEYEGDTLVNAVFGGNKKLDKL